MKLLFVDCESQGPDPRIDNITEIAALLYDTETMGTQIWERLVWDPSYPPQSPKIIELTTITDELLKKEGFPIAHVMAEFIDFMKSADVVFAHKITFDQVILETAAEKIQQYLPKKEWLCTLSNFDWPEKYRCKQLSHLALDHGIKMDGRMLHRAMADVMLLKELVCLYDIEKILAYARAPWVYLQASCAKPWDDNGVQKTIAQAHGFNWQVCKGTDGPLFEKKWVMRCKLNNMESIRESINKSPSPFIVHRMIEMEKA